MKASFTFLLFYACIGFLTAQPCTDLQGVDFGPCDAFLGFGLVDGECTAISGCSTVGSDGIDYAEHFSSSETGCQVLCETDDCIDLASVDFGLCAAVIGVGLINGQCLVISGCGTVGSDGVDYADYIYEDTGACEEQCDEVLECIELGNVDFGDCEMIIGYGLVNSICTALSGCSTTGMDGVILRLKL